MTVIITDTTVYTGDSARSVLYSAAITIDGDVISDVGDSRETIENNPGAEIVSGRGKAVFPGLINCHTHLLAVD